MRKLPLSVLIGMIGAAFSAQKTRDDAHEISTRTALPAPPMIGYARDQGTYYGSALNQRQRRKLLRQNPHLRRSKKYN